jgi:cell wall-associated NlpC family hydrolase
LFNYNIGFQLIFNQNRAKLFRQPNGTLKKGAFCFRRCNLKKIAILGIAGLLVVSCSASIAVGDIRHNAQSVNTNPKQQSVINYSIAVKQERELNIAKMAEGVAKQKNAVALEKRIKQLKKYVNRVPYVFSGSSPSGWDCSGLTRWFYEGLGVELEHSASKQARYAGTHVSTPKPGDIVAFKHLNSEKYYHVGIYIGNGKVVHARKPGTKTEIIKLTDSWFAQSEISFVRVIEN